MDPENNEMVCVAVDLVIHHYLVLYEPYRPPSAL